MIQIEQANAANLMRFYGRTAPYTLTGFVAFEDGEPIAVAGVYRAGGYRIMFSDLKNAARKYRVRIFKEAKRLIGETRGTVYAVAAQNEPTAPRFLERLGFRKVDHKTDLYIMEKK